MKFESLKLAYGYTLQLQTENVAGLPERFSCQLVGCLPDRSVLVTVPKKAGQLLRFRSGQKVVIRFIVDNGVGVFVSQVETQSADPYPLLHLIYPEKVTFKAIRNSVRVRTNLSAKIASSNGDEAVAVTIVDISETGCRIVADHLELEESSPASLQLTINVQSISRVLNVACIVRSKLTDSGGDQVVLGIEFDYSNLNEETKLALLAFVYAEIIQQEVSLT
ncbi:MAG: flagellar brake protein [Cellvibrio sp.]